MLFELVRAWMGKILVHYFNVFFFCLSIKHFKFIKSIQLVKTIAV